MGDHNFIVIIIILIIIFSSPSVSEMPRALKIIIISLYQTCQNLTLLHVYCMLVLLKYLT